jgi:hypothetical protein
MTLEVLHVPDCPNLPPMLNRLAEVTDEPVTTRLIESDTEAARFGMAGSPTLLIDGVDPFPSTQDCDCDADWGISCRLYRDQDDRIVTAPSAEQLRQAITAATTATTASTAATVLPEPGKDLSASRARTLPLDPVERTVLQAILRAFAATGHPPAIDELHGLTADIGRSSVEVLMALHAVDAIRLVPTGHIAVAYPFSATPTRHRVRIGGADSEIGQGSDDVDVYAMCAIDALGIAAMVGRDTRIESVDLTTGTPVTVTIRGDRSRWHPLGAVVFVGADTCSGPSADNCCEYLNFFADRESARAWIRTHPQITGQLLDHHEAEDLGVRLFGHLLAPDFARPASTSTLRL